MSNQDLIVHARLVRQTARPAKEITADFASIKSSIEATGKASVKEARELDKLGREYNRLTKQQRDFADKLKHTGNQMTLGLTVPILAGLGAATKRFSDLNEAADAAFRTMGTGYGRIAKLAATANKELGLSRRAVNEQAVAFAGLLQQAGMTKDQASQATEALIRRGVDLGSKYNVGSDDVAQKLVAGLVGEAEPLRQLQVFLSESAVKQEAYRSGIAKTGAELTEGQKIQARYNLIMKDSASAAGNMAATADSIANTAKRASAASEDLAATYGERLAPVMKELLDSGIGLLEFFTDLPGGVQTATIALLGLASVAGPILTLAGSFVTLRAAIIGAQAASGVAGAAGAAGATGAAGALAPAAGVAALIAAPVMIEYGILGTRDARKKQQLAANSRQLAMSGLNITDPAAIRARYQATLQRQAGLYNEADRLQRLAETGYRHGGVDYQGRRLTAGTWDREVLDASQRAKWEAESMKATIEELRTLDAGAYDTLTASTKKAVDATSGLSSEVERLGPRFEGAHSRMTRFFDVYRRSIQGARDDLRDMSSAWDESIGRFLGRDSNELAFQRTIASAMDAMKGTDGAAKQASIIDIFSGAQSSAQWLLDNGYITADQLSSTTYGYLQKASAQLGKLDPDIQGQWDAYITEMYRWAADVSRMAIADTYDAIQRTPASVSRSGILPRSRNVPLGDSPYPYYRGPVLGHDGALASTLGMYGALANGLGTRISNALIGQHPGSDHFRGRALDLVGSGLPGLQARLIAAGGRAEFHGIGAGRHLHTVYPAGDSSHGYSAAMDSRRGGSSTSIGQITIMQQPGESASGVIDELERRVRSAQERGVPWP